MSAIVLPIVVEDAGPPPPKRRLVEADYFTDSYVSSRAIEAEPHLAFSDNEAHLDICEDTVICFGMVGQPSLNQHLVLTL